MRDDHLGDDFGSDVLYNSSSCDTCSQWSGEHGEAVEETDLGSDLSSGLYESRELRPVS